MTIVMCLGCKNEKAELITQFNNLYHETKFESYPSLMDNESVSFYEKMVDQKNLNIDSLIAIGIEYKVPYFTTLYLASCGDLIKESNDPEDFFLYLAANNISFFSIYEDYEVIPDKVRIDNDGWIAIFRREAEKNYVSWVKYTSEDNGLHFDLLYTLRVQEREYRPVSYTHLTLPTKRIV